MGLSTVPARDLCTCNVNHAQRNCCVFSIIDVNSVHERNQASSVSQPLDLSSFQENTQSHCIIELQPLEAWFCCCTTFPSSAATEPIHPTQQSQTVIVRTSQLPRGNQGDERSRKLFQTWTENPLVQNEDTYARGEREQAKFGLGEKLYSGLTYVSTELSSMIPRLLISLCQTETLGEE